MAKISRKEKKSAVALVSDALDVTLKDLAVEFDIEDGSMPSEWERQFNDFVDSFVEELVAPWYEKNS